MYNDVPIIYCVSDHRLRAILSQLNSLQRYILVIIICFSKHIQILHILKCRFSKIRFSKTYIHSNRVHDIDDNCLWKLRRLTSRYDNIICTYTIIKKQIEYFQHQNTNIICGYGTLRLVWLNLLRHAEYWL